MQIKKYNVPKKKEGTASRSGSSNGIAINDGNNFMPVNLWGQYFDDTKDIDGSMSVKGDIDITGNFSGESLNVTDITATNINADYSNIKKIESDNADIKKATIDTVEASTITSTNITNEDTITTKNLNVTGQAHFWELVIDKIKACGGSIIATPADGFSVDSFKTDTDTITLYWRAEGNDGKAKNNMWIAGDQAICQSFNQAKVGTQHNISNKYYWALVTDAGMDTVNDILYNYITISKKDKDGTVNVDIGDEIAMLGNRNDTTRQSAIYITAYNSIDKGVKAPLIAQYRGINDFNLDKHRYSYFDALGAKFIGDFQVSSGESLEDWIKKQFPSSDDGNIKLNTFYAYATSKDGSENFNTEHFDDATYIGIQITANLQQSKKYTDYTWSEIGKNGENADFYQLVYNQSYAYVDKDGKLTVHGDGELVHYTGGTITKPLAEEIALYQIKVINNLTTSPVRKYEINENAKFEFTFYIDKWFEQTTKEGSYIFQLIEKTGGKTIYQTVNNVTFSAQAILDIKQNHDGQIASITARVTGLEGDFSEIKLTEDKITAKVTENVNGNLKTTGIDIENGTIKLYAANTKIEGDLSLYATNNADALRFFDATNVERVNVTSQNIGKLSTQNMDSNQTYHVDTVLQPNDNMIYKVEGKAFGKDEKVEITKVYWYVMHEKMKQLSNAASYKVKVRLYYRNDETKYVETNLFDGVIITGVGIFFNVTDILTIPTAGYYDFLVTIQNATNASKVNFTNETVKSGVSIIAKTTVLAKTLIGADGLYSTHGMNHYIYYGEDGFATRGNNMSLKVGYDSGDTSQEYLYCEQGYTGAATYQYFPETNGIGSPHWTASQQKLNTQYIPIDGTFDVYPSTDAIILSNNTAKLVKLNLEKAEFDGHAIDIVNINTSGTTQFICSTRNNGGFRDGGNFTAKQWISPYTRARIMFSMLAGNGDNDNGAWIVINGN